MIKAALILALLLGACAEEPGFAPIVGPDGTRMLHVHCGGKQAACFQVAGSQCPSGYDLSPIFDPHDGNFLVRCRNPALTIQATVTSSPNNSSVTQRAPDIAWPPSEVAKPTQPWPPPSTATTQPPITDVDLGY